jgi:hypothetical protein
MAARKRLPDTHTGRARIEPDGGEEHRNPLKLFHLNLSESRIAYDNDPRWGTQCALIAVMLLIARLYPEDEEGLAQPFRALTMALRDLEHGVVSPLVARAKVPGKRRIPSPEMHVRTIAEMAIRALLLHDDPSAGRSMDERVKDAANRVAAVLKAHRFPIGGQIETPAWEVVRNWGDNLGKGKYDPAMQDLSEEIWPGFAAMEGHPPEVVKKLITDALGALLDQRDWKRTKS